MAKRKVKNIAAPIIQATPQPEQPKVWIKDNIAPVAVQRIKHDIAKWRLAIQEAETPTNPQRYMMQQQYLDTDLNGHITACYEKRYANVLKKGIEVINEKGEQNEELTKLYNKRWMYDIIKYTLDARKYGYNLIQLGDMKDYEFDEVYVIRRSNVNPELEIVTNHAYALEGTPIKDPRFSDNLIWVTTQSEVGRISNWGKCGYGLLYKVVPLEIWYRQALTLWNEYQQLFGMPIRIGKTNTRDEQMRNQMSQMLANMGAAAWGVFDTDDDIELVDSGNMTGGNEVYITMIDKIEKIISKVILGHSDALDSVPGKLGSSDGDKSASYLAMKDVEAFDCQFVEFELQKNIIPKLVGLGFPMPNNKATADMVKVLFDSGVKVDVNWLSERTGIPMEEKPEPKPEKAITKNLVDERESLTHKINDLYNGCSH